VGDPGWVGGEKKEWEKGLQGIRNSNYGFNANEIEKLDSKFGKQTVVDHDSIQLFRSESNFIEINFGQGL
jgi:hypothetical protein